MPNANYSANCKQQTVRKGIFRLSRRSTEKIQTHCDLPSTDILARIQRFVISNVPYTCKSRQCSPHMCTSYIANQTLPRNRKTRQKFGTKLWSARNHTHMHNMLIATIVGFIFLCKRLVTKIHRNLHHMESEYTSMENCKGDLIR